MLPVPARWRRLAGVTTWLVLGQAAVGALYWVFLNTPESNALMLAASALLVGAMTLAAGIAVGAAIRTSASADLARAVQGAPWIVVAAVPLAAVWWGVGRADQWIAAHSGEIAAWFIATMGLSDVSWLMRGLAWLSLWLRAIVAPLLAVSLFAALLGVGRFALGRTGWIRQALRWRTLVAATIAYALLIALPMRAAYWRPTGLPPTWVEPALAGVRLLVIGLVASVGAALIVMAVVGRPTAAGGPPSEGS